MSWEALDRGWDVVGLRLCEPEPAPEPAPEPEPEWVRVESPKSLSTASGCGEENARDTVRSGGREAGE